MRSRQVNHEAWLSSALSFIREQGLTDSFRDFCGGWPSPALPNPISWTRESVIEECAREIDAAGAWAADCETATRAKFFGDLVRDLKNYHTPTDTAASASAKAEGRSP